MKGGIHVNPLDFVLDFRSGVPIYVQIVEQVQQFVASDNLKPGDQLPTVRQLASELRVNFNTIARAYRMLDEAGLISTQQGRGTYILDQTEEGFRDLYKKESLHVQTERFLAEVERQGFTTQEIRETLEQMLSDLNDNNGNSEK
jgi:GntR family transcriptional regulator